MPQPFAQAVHRQRCGVAFLGEVLGVTGEQALRSGHAGLRLAQTTHLASADRLRAQGFDLLVLDKVLLRRGAQLPEGEATKERSTLFRNMVHTLNHNYVIDRIWQAHLEGREHGYEARNTKDHPPLAELWRLELAQEAVNVNAVDEVPDSSWFTNRISRGPMSRDELRRARAASSTRRRRPT